MIKQNNGGHHKTCIIGKGHLFFALTQPGRRGLLVPGGYIGCYNFHSESCIAPGFYENS